jgi:hypothetical protein
MRPLKHRPRPLLEPGPRNRLPGGIEVQPGSRETNRDNQQRSLQKLLHYPVALPVPQKHQHDKQQIAALKKERNPLKRSTSR